MIYTFEQSIGKLSRQTALAIGDMISQEFKRKGLKYNAKDWMYISFILNTKNISQNELAEKIGFNKVMINRGVEKLEKDGIVVRKRNKKDQRVKQLSLSPKGKLLYKKLEKIVESSLQLMFDGIDEQRKKECFEVLQSILANIATVVKR
jgi:DNA-binding MarR family transcriptional regulator